METLITDFSNFEVKTLRNTIVPFKNDSIEGHYEFRNYGLFHKPTNSWVSLGSTCKYTGIALPTQYSKSVWDDVMKGGITTTPELGFALVDVKSTLPYNWVMAHPHKTK